MVVIAILKILLFVVVCDCDIAYVLNTVAEIFDTCETPSKLYRIMRNGYRSPFNGALQCQILCAKRISIQTGRMGRKEEERKLITSGKRYGLRCSRIKSARI